MKKALLLLIGLTIVSACSKDETMNPEPESVQVQKYTITISAGEGGIVSSEGGTFNKDSEVSVTATPDAEYLFQSWSDGSTDNPRTIKVGADLTIIANFVKKQYDLTVTVVGDGAVTEEVVIQGGRYNSGSQIKLTATAAEGWEFASWSGAIESTDNPITINISTSKEVSATFIRKKYDLTITIEGEGTVTEEVVVQPGQYDYETQIKLTAVPAEGWEFDSWSGEIESEENPITVTLVEDMGISALFVESVNGVSSSIDLCKLENNPVRSIAFGFPRYQYSLPAKGLKKFTLIFVDFDDAPATKSVEEVYNVLSPVSSEFFYKSSYGKLEVEFDVIDKWYRMPKSSSEYNMSRGNATGTSHRLYLEEALSLADEDYDFSQTDTFIVITNPEADEIDFGPAFIGNDFWNFKADGKTFYTSTSSGSDLNVWGGKWLNHEVFHNMGLPDLYNYSGNPTWHGFVGQFSIMGLISGRSPDLFAYEKWMLGWIDEGKIFCSPEGTSVVDLTPIERSDDGTKMIILPISSEQSLIVESRRSIELDQNLPNEGVLVYLVDTSVASGAGTIKVLPYDPMNQTKFDQLLGQGEQLNYGGYSIEVVISSAVFDRIKITK